MSFELLLQILLADIDVQGSPLAFEAAKALKDTRAISILLPWS
jgi:hypothetical protein